MRKFLLGFVRAMSPVMPVYASHQSQCCLYQTKNQITRNQDGIYINLETYHITVVCPVKHFTYNRFMLIEVVLLMKRILRDSQPLKGLMIT